MGCISCYVMRFTMAFIYIACYVFEVESYPGKERDVSENHLHKDKYNYLFLISLHNLYYR
jgi:hypothetical protein